MSGKTRGRPKKLLSIQIPTRLPNGKPNPEYRKAYFQYRKAMGISNISPELQRQYHQKRKEEGRLCKSETIEGIREYRATEKGRASTKRWRESEKGKAASKRYRNSEQYKRKRSLKETPEAYASRIIRDLERINEGGEA